MSTWLLQMSTVVFSLVYVFTCLCILIVWEAQNGDKWVLCWTRRCFEYRYNRFLLYRIENSFIDIVSKSETEREQDGEYTEAPGLYRPVMEWKMCYTVTKWQSLWSGTGLNHNVWTAAKIKVEERLFLFWNLGFHIWIPTLSPFSSTLKRVWQHIKASEFWETIHPNTKTLCLQSTENVVSPVNRKYPHPQTFEIPAGVFRV